MILKSLLLSICLFYMSCTTVRYINSNDNCLTNKPEWKLHFDVIPLRGLVLRVDSFYQKGLVKEALLNHTISFSRFELFLRMNNERPRTTRYDTTPKPVYVEELIQINLSVSDTLTEAVISNLCKEDNDVNIEKGYAKRKNFLYINNYPNENVQIIVNLRTRIAYKLEQDKENLINTYTSLDAFLRDGCRQGIKFIGKDGSFSFGDYMMY